MGIVLLGLRGIALLAWAGGVVIEVCNVIRISNLVTTLI